jgi:integrase/recombinase XerC
MAGLKQPIIRPTDVAPRAVKSSTLEKLLTANASLPRISARNGAIIALLFDVGPRVSELVAIDREDVFLDQGYVVIGSPAKNGPIRHLPLGKATTRAMRLHFGRSKGTGPLFLGERHERMTGAAVRQVIARLSQKALVPRVFPHAFRHQASSWYTALEAPASAKNGVFGWKPGPSDMEAG